MYVLAKNYATVFPSRGRLANKTCTTGGSTSANFTREQWLSIVKGEDDDKDGGGCGGGIE